MPLKTKKGGGGEGRDLHVTTDMPMAELAQQQSHDVRNHQKMHRKANVILSMYTSMHGKSASSTLCSFGSYPTPAFSISITSHLKREIMKKNDQGDCRYLTLFIARSNSLVLLWGGDTTEAYEIMNDMEKERNNFSVDLYSTGNRWPSMKPSHDTHGILLKL